MGFVDGSLVDGCEVDMKVVVRERSTDNMRGRPMRKRISGWLL